MSTKPQNQPFSLLCGLTTVLLPLTILLISGCHPAEDGGDSSSQTRPTTPQRTPKPISITITPPASTSSDVFFAKPTTGRTVTQVSIPIQCEPNGCSMTCAIDAAQPEECSNIYTPSVTSGEHTLVVTASLGAKSKTKTIKFVRLVDPLTITSDSSHTTLYSYNEIGKLSATCNTGSTSLPCTLTCEVTSTGGIKETIADCETGRILDFTKAPFNSPDSFTFHVKGCVDVGGQSYCKEESRSYTIEEPKWERLSAANETTCAIRKDSTLWCWGSRHNGVIGDGGDSFGSTAPVRIGKPEDRWWQVSVGFQHACAIKTDSTLWCWGNRGFGALGSGTLVTGNTTTPRQVINPEKWLSVSVGHAITCGIDVNNDAYCWGHNLELKPGKRLIDSDSAEEAITTPHLIDTSQLSTSSSLSDIIVGNDMIVLVVGTSSSSLAAYSWGKNDDYRLGLGNTEPQLLPSQKMLSRFNDPTYMQISLGSNFGCSIAGPNGMPDQYILQCWGDNSQKGLAITTGAKRAVQPTTHNPAYRYREVSLSDKQQTACAISDTSKMVCWGSNASNVVSSGGKAEFETPTLVSGLESMTFTHVALGGDHACGIATDKSLWCWGDPSNHHLGNTQTAVSPVKITIP